MPRYLTDADWAAYGDDLIQMTGRAARDALAPELEDVKRRQYDLAQREQRLQNQHVFDALDRALPGWRVTNNSDAFKAWLSQQEELSGVRAWDLLLQAFAAADVPRILVFFRDFLAASGQAPASPAQSPTSQRQSPTSQRANVITNKDQAVAALSKLYDEAAHGKWNGREAEKLSREQALHDIIHGRR